MTKEALRSIADALMNGEIVRPEDITQEFVICVAMDAFASAIGKPERHFPTEFIIRWISALSPPHPSGKDS